MHDKPIYAWHFSDGFLRFDYEGQKIEAGLVLETEAQPVPEKSGFHACTNPIHALRWFAVRPSPNIVVSRVRLSGTVVEDKRSSALFTGERLVSQRREHLWVGDALDTLEQYTNYYLSEWKRLWQFYDKELSVIRKNIDYCIAYWNDKLHTLKPNEDLLKIRQPQFDALEVAAAALASAQAVYNRVGWQRAKADNFDINEYFRRHKLRFEDFDRSNAAKRVELETILRLFFAGQGLLNAPEKYNSECPVNLIAPDKKLHDMLMQLAPEGYREL